MVRGFLTAEKCKEKTCKKCDGLKDMDDWKTWEIANLPNQLSLQGERDQLEKKEKQKLVRKLLVGWVL